MESLNPYKFNNIIKFALIAEHMIAFRAENIENRYFSLFLWTGRIQWENMY